MPSPQTPPLTPPLRLAKASDIPRIAQIAVSGFYYSNVGSWQRPYAHQYPVDNYQDYASQFATRIRDPTCVCAVVEDAYKPDEASATGAGVKPDRPMHQPREGENVVVGAIAIRLHPNSPLIGHFQDASDSGDVFSAGPQRHQDHLRIERLETPTCAVEDRLFTGYHRLELTVVHPAYSGRGHGKRLAKWGIALAEADGVPQGVIASKMGRKLYLSLGYELLDTGIGRDDGNPPSEAEFAALMHKGGRDDR